MFEIIFFIHLSRSETYDFYVFNLALRRYECHTPNVVFRVVSFNLNKKRATDCSPVRSWKYVSLMRFLILRVSDRRQDS
jgi:hypothetical protein